MLHTYRILLKKDSFLRIRYISVGIFEESEQYRQAEYFYPFFIHSCYNFVSFPLIERLLIIFKVYNLQSLSSS